MASNHFIVPQAPMERVTAVRLGAGNASNQRLKDLDAGKLVKLAGESQYDLCAAGDYIDGVITAVESATSNGWSVGGIVQEGKVFATADGLQATAGTGSIAIGDYVVAGTAVALNSAMSGYPKVCKATYQPGVAIDAATAGADTAAAVNTVLDAALVKVAAQQQAVLHAWKVVSLGSVGTGAVGTTIVIERC